MGRVNPIVGRGMALRLVLLRADVSGDGTGPRVPGGAYDGEREQLAPGVWCFRREGGRVFVVWRVRSALVSGTRYVLVVVYAPGASRDDASAFVELAADLDVDIVRRADGTRCVWAIVIAPDGSFRVPSLDADASAIGVAIKSNFWPADWRVRLPADTTAPTGPRCVAEVLA